MIPSIQGKIINLEIIPQRELAQSLSAALWEGENKLEPDKVKPQQQIIEEDR